MCLGLYFSLLLYLFIAALQLQTCVKRRGTSAAARYDERADCPRSRALLSSQLARTTGGHRPGHSPRRHLASDERELFFRSGLPPLALPPGGPPHLRLRPWRRRACCCLKRTVNFAAQSTLDLVRRSRIKRLEYLARCARWLAGALPRPGCSARVGASPGPMFGSGQIFN